MRPRKRRRVEGEPEPEFLWRQYSLWLDFCKFHIDLLLKANTFFYLITRGILTFYLAHPEQRMLRLSMPADHVNGLRVLLWATAIILLVAPAALLALATGWVKK